MWQVRWVGGELPDLFADFNGIEEFDKKVEFYQHEANWSNRMILGDSLLVMTSLVEKEGLKGKVQMIYIDPPYGIKFNSNWQVSTRKRDVKDGKAEDATRQPEQIRAFRDTWKLGIHSYLAYLRDRLVVSRELLTETGSVFVQIGDENVHLVRCVLDEVFGAENFMGMPVFRKTSAKGSAGLDSVCDFLLWYSRDKHHAKQRKIFAERSARTMESVYNWIEEDSGECRHLRNNEMNGTDIGSTRRRFMTSMLHSQSGGETSAFPFHYDGRVFKPAGFFWKTTEEGLKRLDQAGRLLRVGNTLMHKRYADDHPVVTITGLWEDTIQSTFAVPKIYVVQTANKVVERCLMLTTDPGDLVLDPTCVRRGTRVWRTDPPLNPPARGGKVPSPRAGRVREGVPSGRVREGAVSVPIESLQPGDWVLAHDGCPHQITRIIQRQYQGKMIGIKHRAASEALWLTADHRVWATLRPRSLGGQSDWSGSPLSHRERRKALRREMTPPERALWKALRANGAGAKFRRQHPIGAYIADFYSREARLVVEVDGEGAHGTPEAVEYDSERDAYMHSLGLRVLRLPAKEVMSNLEGVYEAIVQACAAADDPEAGSWIEAQHLQKGDTVFHGLELVGVRIESISSQETCEEVYDLEVADAHSFVTEVCAIHNCGSGTTAYVAEQWGRRWITIDTSRVAHCGQKSTRRPGPPFTAQQATRSTHLKPEKSP